MRSRSHIVISWRYRDICNNIVAYQRCRGLTCARNARSHLCLRAIFVKRDKFATSRYISFARAAALLFLIFITQHAAGSCSRASSAIIIVNMAAVRLALIAYISTRWLHARTAWRASISYNCARHRAPRVTSSASTLAGIKHQALLNARGLKLNISGDIDM